MLRLRWRRSCRLLALVSLVLAMAVSAVPATAASADASTSRLTKKGDIGPDGLPIPPGGVRVGNEVFYDNGRVALRFDLARAAKLQGKSAPTSTAVDFICNSGWYCLFEHSNFGGRRLSFQDCCYFQYLSNYGFQNKVSSWRSNLNINDVRVWDTAPSPDKVLWCSDTQSQSTNVGTAANDKADKLYIQSSDGYC
jgi:Peptidase inhibitor family I36